MPRPLLYALSFYTNAAILVFEITGGRLLAPYIGTSVQVWAALIAVVLGGMAIGYHFGGRFADRNATAERIGLLMFAAGVAALLSWSMRDLVGTYVGMNVAIEPGALLAGGVLFMPTVILLAAVSPMLAKNLIQRLENSAKVVGELTAAGTAGSILGALATGLWLIPSFGVGTILLSVAVSLLLVGLFMLRARMLKFLGITALCAAAVFFINGLPTYASGSLADLSTGYNRMFVRDGTTNGTENRALVTGPGGVQCVMQVNADGTLDEKTLVMLYQQAHAVATENLFSKGPRNALTLGGCALTLPRYLERVYPEMHGTVVEIDAGMTRAAQDYFGFDASAFPNLSVIHEDARIFLNNNTEKYDALYFDAYNSSGRVPFQLVTKEAFQKMAGALTDDGVLIMNSYGSYGGEGALFPSTFVKTMQTAFPYVGFYEYGGKPEDNQNVVLIATKTKPLPDAMTSPNFPGMTLTRVTTQENVITLTDDYAPVEGIFRDKLRI